MTSSETTAGQMPRKAKIRPLAIPAWFRNNPIILKEMQSRMRNWRSLGSLTGFIALLSIVVGLIYTSMTELSNVVGIDVLNELGRTIFFTVYGIELFVVCMVSPALTSGAISGEKEQQTYDLLRTTLLSARNLILGKLIAAISFVLLFMVATVPLQSIAFIFGGISLGEIVIAFVIMGLTAITFGSIGIFYTSFISKTRVATALSQITGIVFVIVIPVITLITINAIDSQININQMSDLFQVVFFSSLWLICITSPAAAAVLTEFFLTEQQTLFYFTEQLPGGTTILIPSPWLGFIILYPILSLILLSFAIRFVQRAEK